MLIGVRISAFVSLDDKKPLQKSIIGFLQPGKTDASSSTQEVESSQKVEKEHFSSLSAVSSTHTCQAQEGVPWRSKQKRLDGGQTSEQQSFFQRAHAKRLQLQAVNTSTQEEGPGENDTAFSPVDTAAKVAKSISLDRSENALISSAEVHASTSGSGGSVPDTLTCPVCFKHIETTDLNVFNRHIDQCLSDGSTKPDQRASPESESDLDLEIDHENCKVVDKWGGECGVKEEKVRNSEELEFNRVDPQEAHQSLKDDENKAVTTQQPQSGNDEGPILICPVCHLTQDTADLTIFNHHVDLCLNQEVLHELRGQTTPKNLPLVSKSKVIGEFYFTDTLSVIFPRLEFTVSTSATDTYNHVSNVYKLKLCDIFQVGTRNVCSGGFQ